MTPTATIPPPPQAAQETATPPPTSAGFPDAPQRKPARPAPLNVGRIARDTAWMLALFLLNLGGNYGAGLFFAILAGMTLKSPIAAYKAIMIANVGLALNEAFVPKSLVWTIARLVLPMLVLARFSLDLFGGGKRSGLSAPYTAFLVYVFAMAGCSYASGWYTHIALLKLLNFWILITMVFAGVEVLRRTKADTSEWFVSVISAVAIVGFAAVATGQSRNFIAFRYKDTSAITADSLFNGAFLHPNSHAAYASLFVVFLVSVYLFSPYRRRWITLPLIGIWIGFMLYSRSRTSIIATVVPLLTVLPIVARRVARKGMLFRSHLSRPMLAGLLAASLMGLLVVDLVTDRSVSKSVVQFLHKWDQTETLDLDTETMLSSRQGKIDESWANFRENPIHGIGFGVAKNDFFVQNATLFTAPAEKGFLVSAILEEGGVIGASAFMVFMLTLLWGLLRTHNAPALLALMCMITSNMGEVTMFAPGGSGSFLWLMFGVATILGDRCWQPTPPPATSNRERGWATRGTSAPPFASPVLGPSMHHAARP